MRSDPADTWSFRQPFLRRFAYALARALPYGALAMGYVVVVGFTTTPLAGISLLMPVFYVEMLVVIGILVASLWIASTMGYVESENQAQTVQRLRVFGLIVLGEFVARGFGAFVWPLVHR